MPVTKIIPANRTELVVEQLSEAILSGEIEKGSFLPPERELALQLGVSRTILREGTKILQSRGLITVRPGNGTIVNGWTTEPIKQVLTHAISRNENKVGQLIEARLGLEVKIAELAALRATSQDIEEMEELIKRFAAKMDDLQECARLDVAFHEALARSTNNPVFLAMLEPLSDLLAEARLSSLSRSNPKVALSHHRKILAAVEKKQPEQAARAMKHHLEVAMQELQQLTELNDLLN